jgi:lipoate-protein ligase A
MLLTDKLSASDQVVAREVGGEMVLLDLASGTYFGLNTVGARVWSLIEEAEGPTLLQICNAVFDEFQVQRDELERDVLALTEKLAEARLVNVERT